jgi:TPR repeat protein
MPVREKGTKASRLVASTSRSLVSSRLPLHAGGYNLPEDRATAQRWFRAAAELGHGHALAAEPDPAEARVWLEHAVAQGVAEAQDDLAALSAQPSYPRV